MGALDNFIIDLKHLSLSERVVFQKIARYKDTNIGHTIQSQEAIAEGLGISARSVSRAAKRLASKEIGFIEQWKKDGYVHYRLSSWFYMEWDMAMRKAGSNLQSFKELCDFMTEPRGQNVQSNQTNCPLAPDTMSDICLSNAKDYAGTSLIFLEGVQRSG